jgi:2-amino-4-hydroxy-6-hydroxymethyldihydropteridine diphosphokinase
MKGYLGLGCNVGDRRANLQAAVDKLAQRGVTTVASSSTYDTDPVGELLDQASFLNACIAIETSLDPVGLLEACQEVERELGRVQAGAEGYVRHGPRALDVDILLLGDVQLQSTRLTVPHPALRERRFVLVPLLELDLELATPDGALLAEALAELPLEEGVRRAGAPLAAAPFTTQ